MENQTQTPDEATQTLVNLGLTFLQAKVYLALNRLGTLSGRETAKAAKIAPQDVYRILTELQEKELVEKIIDRPNKYKPIPLKDGLLMFIQQRNKETTQLQQAIQEMIKQFEKTKNNNSKRETGNFALVPAKESLKKRAITLIETAKTSLNFMNEYQEGMIGHEIIFELEARAIDQGVTIKDILGKNKNKCEPPEIPSKFANLTARNPMFQVRYCQFPPPAILLIKDNKELLISTNSTTNMSQPYLWSNNPILVNVIQQWYDTMWEKCGQTQIPVCLTQNP